MAHWKPYDRTTPMFSWEGKQFEARLVSAHDGDTVRVVFQAEPGTYKQFILRLEGLDTPEITSHDPEERAAAVAARDRLLNLAAPEVFPAGSVPQASKAVEKLLHDEVVLVHLQTGAFDRYGRLLSKLWPLASPPPAKSINETLVAEGHAYRYFGKTKQPFHKM